MNILLEKNTPLTAKEKAMFAYFGENAKIRPPFRILNPHRIYVGDYTSIREGAFIHAYEDSSDLIQYIKPEYQADFNTKDYLFDSRIVIGRENQIGRSLLMSCTHFIEFGANVLLSERVFIGDNNHSFSHPHVPIMQQPNKKGSELLVGNGSWIGIGAALVQGASLGSNCVVGANAVVNAKFADHSVVGPEPARLLYKRHGS